MLMKMLIVNDEVITAQTLFSQFEWKQFDIEEVFLAYDASEAKRIIEKEEIDIILCDIEMPGENGIELLSWIRAEQFKIECIFLTCHANFTYAQEALKLGCTDYVLLPAQNVEIEKALKNVVNKKMQIQENERLQKYGLYWVNTKKDVSIEEQGVKRNPAQLVADCETYILENIEKVELSVNEVASSCHLSPIYLNRLFKKEMKMSISQYIIQEKMILAAKLLENGELAANTVALRVGYHSYPHFSSTFKKFHDCSPKNYNKENFQSGAASK